MTKKRILTIVNIVFSVLLLISIFMPITNASLYDRNQVVTSFMLFLSILSIVVNAFDKKVEYTLVTGGFCFFFTLNYGWGLTGLLNYGYYFLLISSLAILVITVVYGFLPDEDKNKKVINNPYQNRIVNRNLYRR